MHIKGYVITKNKPTLNEIYDILEPYYEGNDNNVIGWDWLEIGGRYRESIKTKSNIQNKNIIEEKINNSFISKIMKIIKNNNELEEDKNEDIIEVNGAYYKDTIDFDITSCYLVFDNESNKLYIREKWDGRENKVNENFEEEIKNIDLENKFITVVDFHV